MLGHPGTGPALRGLVARRPPAGEAATPRTSAAPLHIGKFDILATYACARSLLDGHPDTAARERGIVAAVMGARNHLGPGSRRKKDAGDNFDTFKQAAERKKKSALTVETFDRQVSGKMGPYFDRTFLPVMKRLVRAGLSYDEVKRAGAVPPTWGAKLPARDFVTRARDYLRARPRTALATRRAR